MAIRKIPRTPLAAALLLAGSSAAFALTGTDILDKMSDVEGHAYLAGNVEMAAFLTSLQGNRTRSECIMDWYYKKNGIDQLMQALLRFKDRQALPVIHALINRARGE